MTNDIPVVIVGGGFAGVSTAYHLARLGIDSLIIEAGEIAKGDDKFPAGTTSPKEPNFSKWITHAFDSNHDEFTRIHSSTGARTFLELTDRGTELIRKLIKDNNPEIIRELGSLVIAEDLEQWARLKEEHQNYLNLGFGIEHEELPINKVNRKLGLGTSFSGGLYVPTGAIIDQRAYIKMLLRLSGQYVTPCERTRVVSLEEISEGVRVTTEVAGKTTEDNIVTADNVVIATNGFYEDENLRGLLYPKFTFMRCYESKGENTPGCWTFGEKYFYFTRQDNVLIVGGIDEPISAKNDFRIDETKFMQEIQNWAAQKFTDAKPKNLVATHFGIYTRTKDELPIVGKFNPESRISYIVGCNAIGHTTYNIAAELMPALLGYAKFVGDQKRFADFLSPRRKTLK